MTPSSSVSFASYGQSGHAGPAAMPPAGGPVSGEGFRYATAGRRVLALLIDMACVAAVCAAVMFAARDVRLTALCAVQCVALLWGWEACRGRSVGKALMGLCVVRYAPDIDIPGAGLLPAGPLRALARTVVTLVGLALAVVGAFALELSSALDHEHHRGLHDRLSGTAVVDTRVRYRGPATVGVRGYGDSTGTATGTRFDDDFDYDDDFDASSGGIIDTPMPSAPATPPAVPVPSLPAHTPEAGRRAPDLPARAGASRPGASAPPAASRPDIPARPAGPALPAPAAGQPALAEARQVAVLYFENGNGVHLGIPSRAVLGRRPVRNDANDVLVKVPDTTGTISRSHALLEIASGHMWITDLGSTNGTEIMGEDGIRALDPNTRTEIAFGTRIFLGSTAISVSLLRNREKK